ncbi:MAG TPA: DUF3795 domain-containing protein [Bacteroidales bacterium]|nr:DUF3795 domain-containing protein [Bacteroidales bacterium]
MEKIIACCGLNCATCDARIATVTNDIELLIETTEKWKVHYKVSDISAEMIKCTGCGEEGVKMIHCSQCEIRSCVKSKNYQTCADCELMEKCAMVGKIHKYDPGTLGNLKLSKQL